MPRKLEELKGKALYFLELEGGLTTNQVAGFCNPVVSIQAMTIAIKQLQEEDLVEKQGMKWVLVDDEAENADAA